MQAKIPQDNDLGSMKSQLRPNLKSPSEALQQTMDMTGASLVESERNTNLSKLVHAFRVGSLGLLLPENTVSELIENLSVCTIPNANPVLYGVGSLRGAIVPIFDLQKIFGFPKTEHTYFLIIGVGRESVGVLLDALPQQIEVGIQNRYNNIPPLPEALRSYAKVAYKKDGLWIDCNLFEFFKSLNTVID